ncbi:MOSC domain-containing protein [Alkalihalobacillus deserti]|uniref:MOSC domain-containing protein n=1 Tax=Alkalihalobacillus deserti TaxID=2879466 RepID=UPI0035587998
MYDYTVNPDNAERYSNLHKTVIKERQNNFGVYASVIKTGDIHVDDDVHLLD